MHMAGLIYYLIKVYIIQNLFIVMIIGFVFLFLFLSLGQWLALITDCKVPAEETVTETQSQKYKVPEILEV